MIPYLLAIAGGYLLGNATKENVKFAKGGEMADGGMGKNYNVIYEKLDGDIAYKETVNANSINEAKNKFKKKHPTCKILNISEEYSDGGMMAKGGSTLKENDYVWNAVGKKMVVDKVTNDEYYLASFGKLAMPFKKEKINEYIRTGQWTLTPPKMDDGGMMAKGGEMYKSFANGGMTNEDKKYFVVGYDGEGDRELHIIKENLTYEEASALIRRQNKLNQYSWHLLLPMKKFAKGGEMTSIIETDAKDNISDYLVKTLDTDDFVVEILYENVPKTRITFSTYDDNMQELLSATNDYLFEGKGEIEYNQIKGDIPTFLLDYMDSGGKTYTFQDKVNAVAKRLIGTKVPKRLQKDYGKEYSKKEAIMAAKRIIGSQVAKYGDKNTNPKQTSLFKYGAKC